MRPTFAFLGLFAAVVAGGCSQTPASTPGPTPQANAQARGHLEAGERLPPLLCEGWLNGPAPTFDGAQRDGLVVVDLWANWCPFSRACAPGLNETYQKYRAQNVTFVSLTNQNQQSVTQFVAEFTVPWAHGYGAKLETIDALGALNGFVSAPGYEVKPTLYLVDSGGQVLWCDDHARMHHTEPDQIIAELEQALDQNLAAARPTDSP